MVKPMWPERACLMKRKEFLELPRGGRRLNKFGLENQRPRLMWTAQQSVGITADVSLEAWIHLWEWGVGKRKLFPPAISCLPSFPWIDLPLLPSAICFLLLLVHDGNRNNLLLLDVLVTGFITWTVSVLNSFLIPEVTTAGILLSALLNCYLATAFHTSGCIRITAEDKLPKDWGLHYSRSRWRPWSPRRPIKKRRMPGKWLHPFAKWRTAREGVRTKWPSLSHKFLYTGTSQTGLRMRITGGLVRT